MKRNIIVKLDILKSFEQFMSGEIKENYHRMLQFKMLLVLIKSFNLGILGMFWLF